MKDFLLHFRPKKIPAESIKFTLTYGFGGFLAYLFIIEIVSGIILMFVYAPYPEKAYIDVKKITEILPYGYLIRNIHRLCGELMIVFSFLHMSRIVFQNALDSKIRKKNWIYGVFIFFLIFPLNFTGYLLPFDEISYWGATIVLNVVNDIPLIGKFLRFLISGSNIIDGNVLVRFYAYHIIVLPLILLFLIFLHFYYIRRAKGVKVNNKKILVDSKDLFKKELVFLLITTILIILICNFFYFAPLGDYALTANIPEVIEAPWYFRNLQYLLKFFSPIVVLSLIFAYFLFLIKYPEIKNKILFFFLHFLIILLIFLF